MWPGQQPPGGEQNPQAQNNPYQQPGYQQPNPYQQPGFQQPNPYAQQPQWGTPAPAGQPQPPSGGGGNRTKLIAIVAATAVVVAAGVTGFLVLGGDKDDKADDAKAKETKASTSPSAEPSVSASDDNPRGGDTEKATIAGWKVVVNPKWGTAFDVPADWEVQSPGLTIGFEDSGKNADSKPLIVMSAPAYFKSKWCTSDDDKDGRSDDTPLAAVGTKGSDGAKDTNEVAVNQVPWWVFGGYTQPDKKSITFDKKAKAYTTKAGIEGSYAWARSKNSPQIGKSKCNSDGKAITFGFKNSAGDFVAWSLYGATGVKGEVPDATIMKILSTVRLAGTPTGG
ncbi:hypothetical protein [Streptomyces pseudovenezuelae]|uniref:DUF8017 domain-containing protein n=1 Tax=Streptomyces pseudovenezuelae TaxID=67350 RepID=A0ABT6LYR2_9ACTN|nr:hypothetical protein [Streptomyces pseudovenezuelae]MDH6221368.1 hypothetical protein [Streptomyces pseudovenezuelae]